MDGAGGTQESYEELARVVPLNDGWVTLRAASAATGISVSRLRNWRKAGKISSERADDGRVLVRVNEILEVADVAEVPDVVVVERTVFDRLQSAAGRVDQAERGAAEMEGLISTSRQQLQQAVAERRLAQQRVAALEARIEAITRRPGHGAQPEEPAEAPSGRNEPPEAVADEVEDGEAPVAGVTVPLSVSAELPQSSRIKRRLRNMFLPPG